MFHTEKRLEADISQKLTVADYADDLVLPINTSALLLNLDQTVIGIGLYMNLDKTEFMGFK